MDDTAGVFYSDRPLPEGSALVGGRLYNIQDGKEYSCVSAAGTAAVLTMFALVLLAFLV